MKNVDIIAITNAYTAQKSKSDMKIPVTVAWKRRVNMNKLLEARKIIDEALRDIYGEYSDNEHSTADSNGNRTVKKEFFQEFTNRQKELLEQETDVEIAKIAIEDIGDISISDADMDTIAFMIKDGE